MKKTVWIDLSQVSAPLDAEDQELMMMFRNRKLSIDDMMIAVTDNTPAAIMEKKEAASIVKRAETVLLAAVTAGSILVGCVSLACLIAGAGPLGLCSTGIASSALMLSTRCAKYTFF